MKQNLIYDYQIFLKQKYGGPSRYFVELNQHLNQDNFSNEIFAPLHINRHLKSSSFNKKNVKVKLRIKNTLRNKLDVKKTHGSNFKVLNLVGPKKFIKYEQVIKDIFHWYKSNKIYKY